VGGAIDLPSGPGMGIPVNEAKIRQYTVETVKMG
jgi:L-alanine-DL-glutamate epimerase-like enolase superfamily enzyme